MNNRYLTSLVLAISVVVCIGCGKKSGRNAIFQSIDTRSSGLNFQNILSESDSINAYTFLYIYNGSGVAIADLNNDGLKDVVMAGNMVPTTVYVNKGDLQFEPLELPLQGVIPWVHGVSIVDINNDGLQDIYLSVGGIKKSAQAANKLYVNKGDMLFEEGAARFGLADTSLTTHTVFFDYDQDGDLDAYLLNYENNPNKDPNVIRPKNLSGNTVSQDRLYRNDGEIFKEVSAQAGIIHEGYGLGIHTSDFNNDGWLDIYVSNDFAYDDLLYINQQDGTFKESLNLYFEHTSNFGMGIDLADVNNDGKPDLLQVDMLPEDNRRQKKLLSGMNYDRQQMLLARGYLPQYMRNTLQLNTGKEKFQEIGYLAGISTTDWSWSPLIADLDNDGLKDIYITNGYVKDVTDVDFRDYVVNETRKRNRVFDPQVLIGALQDLKGEKVLNYAFRNTNGLQFSNVSEEWGITQPSFSTGAAYGDLDNDGDLDLVVNNLNDPSFLYENMSSQKFKKNYLQIDFSIDGNQQLAIGTKVVVALNSGEELMAEVNPYRGFQSSVDPTVHLGLGESSSIKEVKVIWPDLSESVLSDVKINSRITVEKNKVEIKKSAPSANVAQAFVDKAEERGIDFTHQESPYVDFKREAMLPHKLSTEGPVTALGDVNNDGLEDFYIGGSAGLPAAIFLQKHGIQGATFEKRLIEDQKESEDAGALFFDADSDGDLDLYVVSGSNEFPVGDERYLDRLYLNDGNGNFVRSKESLPLAYYSGSVVVANDVDGDGDLDLFIGGRSLPQNYPKPGTCQLLINEKGKFIDKIDAYAPSLKNVGMVKDAKWVNLLGDEKKELLVAGEFMPLMIFEVANGIIKPRASISGLEDYVGWWNTIEVLDVEGDGDMDIIAGNLGLNSRYKASATEPLSAYASDFDGNGTLDAVLTYYNQGREYPLADRATITQQMPPIKKKFTNNLKYAESTIDKVLPQPVLERAYQVKATHFQSSYFINNGDGTFQMKEMPLQAQFTRVNDMLIFDYDQDGYHDILLAGNSYGTEVFTGNYDAQTALLLRGNGKGEFEAVPLFGSGFIMEGAITAVEKISIDGDSHILTLLNADKAHLFRVNSVDWLSQSKL
ncbi:CRTAC1 family protein [Roseivirga sp. UBA838]|uniref:CRTAC1 family protein n=1 Tax=Roseivirga sp. UBA838 TaxID=1947393 RepID=UPI00257CFFE9|nr:CRTAC1 family protein [Roseivirga sp. UBA838]